MRATRSNDYYLTITESRKKFDDNGYDRHKIFLYKEDFNKFLKALTEAVDFVKTDLMPDFDFDAYNHDNLEEGEGLENGDQDVVTVAAVAPVVNNVSSVPPLQAQKKRLISGNVRPTNCLFTAACFQRAAFFAL